MAVGFERDQPPFLLAIAFTMGYYSDDMFGRFFAFEMGCPDDVTFHDNDVVEEEAEMGCRECNGLGCDKCKAKRKKKPVKVMTLTGEPIALPVMNSATSPWSQQMAMFQRTDFFSR